ncbi:MAG: hypothetical protein Q8R83_03205 [Legionellaceae bacterium]|nr:hypothetical protein [Legionellaceae bacterium]
MKKLNSNKVKPYKSVQGIWLPSDEQTITKIMAVKKQSRLKKGLIFNGFVLVRKKEDNEFEDFLTTLRHQITQIPRNTRMSLAVRTMYYDPTFDTKKDFAPSTIESPMHWTAVDLLVDEQSNVHSFVVDAANSVGYQGIHGELKKLFPNGNHYIFEEDKITMPDGAFKTRIIQTQWRGCHIFALQHLFILSKIDSHTLYHVELPMLAAKHDTNFGSIQPGDFSGELKLAKLFVPTQSISTIESLQISGALVSQKNVTRPLLEAVKNKSTTINSVIGPIEVNQTTDYKNTRYIEKESFFYKFSRHNKKRTMDYRKGDLFLKNRSLFNLNAAVKRFNNLDELHLFIEHLYKQFVMSMDRSHHDLQKFLDELKLLTQTKKLSREEIQYNLIQSIENIFFHLSLKDNQLRKKYNNLLEISLFVYFKEYRVGLVNTNKKILFAQNDSLVRLHSKVQSIISKIDLIHMSSNIQNKIQPNWKGHGLYIENLTDLIELEYSLESSKEKFLFIMDSLFFYLSMKPNEEVRTNLIATIEDILSESCHINDFSFK